jgi:hypothetical protein
MHYLTYHLQPYTVLGREVGVITPPVIREKLESWERMTWLQTTDRVLSFLINLNSFL